MEKDREIRSQGPGMSLSFIRVPSEKEIQLYDRESERATHLSPGGALKFERAVLRLAGGPARCAFRDRRVMRAKIDA